MLSARHDDYLSGTPSSTRSRSLFRLVGAAAVVWAAFVGFPSDVSAQDLALKRSIPQAEAATCTPPSRQLPTPLPEEAAEARRLSGLASQAAILGDREEARELLIRAAGLDPTDARIAYLLGRNMEEAGDIAGAARQYCRYLTLQPNAPDADEVRSAMEQLAPPAASAVPERAVTAFTQGIRGFDEGRYADAEAAFTAASREAPRWADPYYNRALTRRALDRPADAAQDLVQYLELRSEPEDLRGVLAAIVTLNESASPRGRSGPSAGVAFMVGMVPGMGHFYARRPMLGSAVLAGAVGAATMGALYKERTVRCFSRPVNDACPAGQIAEESVDRPYLLPGLGVAAVITVLGAIHASRIAARTIDFDAADGRVAATLQILPIHLEAQGDAVRFSWMRLRF